MKPTNIATIKEYNFKVRATMQGDALFGDEVLTSTNSFKLKVGCGSWATMVEAASFVKTLSVVAESTD